MAAADDTGVAGFGRRFFGAEQTFTRIGAGELGGKAAGLQLIRDRILPGIEAGEFPGFEVAVPTLTVLTTELFDRFMEHNRLHEIALGGGPDDRIAHAFQRGELPAVHVGDLRALIQGVQSPLAVRSSSLLEDALAHPFAGVYGTKMIPNNQPDADTRFRRLVEAIKYVYASTFFRAARSYHRSVGQDTRNEKMAVIIQEVVGERRGERFYPHISAVARSYNYYPSGRAAPEEGVVSLALGLGRQIVDGGLSWTYCPAHPQAPPPYKHIGDLLKNTQTEFWAVHMGKPPLPDPIRETEYLVRAGLAEAEYDDALRFSVSTYDAGSDRLRPGLHGAGPRLLNFAPILAGGLLPLNELLRRLLAESERAVGAAVELEFALVLDRRAGLPARLGFLQARPMMVMADEIALGPEEMEGEGVLLASEQVLGNGVREDLEDIVYVKPETFESRQTSRIALELEGFNRDLQAAGRPYALIGFGRWGSSDPWLGIPVEWGQISEARVLVEATLPEMNPDLSQGSHFFHNLIGFGVLYLSVRHQRGYAIDWDWLARQEVVGEGAFVRRVRARRPLIVKVDGRRGRGVIRHDRSSD
ncbi:MAG: hypothetical protein FJY75_01255 [Candidatus Eisenbacteria bacterium]|uniref:Pyruvate phosphate dikinase AMP/ATP-binding domain-containing protein n=1 Tax=Eiseniibacteriota bacterium TaxID=2212470 RepID=A0A938BPQ2_UNCEI|nr:hypothetical protein [Candidatus Eisenbacteria bacterium]